MAPAIRANAGAATMTHSPDQPIAIQQRTISEIVNNAVPPNTLTQQGIHNYMLPQKTAHHEKPGKLTPAQNNERVRQHRNRRKAENKEYNLKRKLVKQMKQSKRKRKPTKTRNKPQQTQQQELITNDVTSADHKKDSSQKSCPTHNNKMEANYNEYEQDCQDYDFAEVSGDNSTSEDEEYRPHPTTIRQQKSDDQDHILDESDSENDTHKQGGEIRKLIITKRITRAATLARGEARGPKTGETKKLRVAGFFQSTAIKSSPNNNTTPTTPTNRGMKKDNPKRTREETSTHTQNNRTPPKKQIRVATATASTTTPSIIVAATTVQNRGPTPSTGGHRKAIQRGK